MFLSIATSFSATCTYIDGNPDLSSSWSCGKVPDANDDVVVNTYLRFYNHSSIIWKSLTINSEGMFQITKTNLSCTTVNINAESFLFSDSESTINTNIIENNGALSALVGNSTYGKIVISNHYIGTGSIIRVQIIFSNMNIADMTGDGKVNLLDFAILADNWLIEN
jgi:hypothetical protein